LLIYCMSIYQIVVQINNYALKKFSFTDQKAYFAIYAVIV
jgi:hypothetical protein